MKKKIWAFCVMPLIASANLPYEGVTNCKTPIIRPVGEVVQNLDAGYEVDKSCDTIFVLPPRTGDAVISSAFLTGGASLCEGFERSKKHYLDAELMLDNIETRLSSNEGLSEVEVETLERQRKYAQLRLDRLQEKLDQAKDTIGLVAKINFETEWGKLLQAYDAANPGKSVKRVPVVASVLSIMNQKKSDVLGSLSSRGSATNGVYSVEIPGVKLASTVDLLDLIGAQDVGDSSFLFGNSLSAQLQLNHFGMCSLRDVFSSSEEEETLRSMNNRALRNGIDAQIVANLNLWYPVHLNENYTVKVDVEKISDAVDKFVKRKNTFSTREFVDMMDSLETKESISISLVSDHVNANTKGEIEDIKTQVLDDITIKLINQVADAKVNSIELITLEPPSDPHIYVTESRRLCRTKRRLFSRSTHCWTENYQVKKSVEGVANAVVKKVQKFSVKYNENVDQFSTVLRSTTLGFTNKE